MIGLIYEWEQTADFITVNVQLPGMLFRKPRFTAISAYKRKWASAVRSFNEK